MANIPYTGCPVNKGSPLHMEENKMDKINNVRKRRHINPLFYYTFTL